MNLQFWFWYYCFICWVASCYVALIRYPELSKKYNIKEKPLYLLAFILTVILSPLWLLVSVPMSFVKLIIKGIRWVIK